jgi:hypothetical protein
MSPKQIKTILIVHILSAIIIIHLHLMVNFQDPVSCQLSGCIVSTRSQFRFRSEKWHQKRQ